MKQYRIKNSDVTVWAFDVEDAIRKMDAFAIHLAAKDLEIIFDYTKFLTAQNTK